MFQLLTSKSESITFHPFYSTMKNSIYQKHWKNMKLMTSGKIKGKATSWNFWLQTFLTSKNQVLCWKFLKIRAPLSSRKIIKSLRLVLSCKTEEFWGISILTIQSTKINSIKLRVKGKYSSGEPIFWCGRPATVRTNDLLQLPLESHQERVLHFLFRTWSHWN